MLQFYDTKHYCKYNFYQDTEFDITKECTVSSLCKLGPVCIPYKMPAIKMKRQDI